MPFAVSLPAESKASLPAYPDVEVGDERKRQGDPTWRG